MTNDQHEEDADRGPGEELTPAEYEGMLLLERLESLEEDMLELGVATLTEVRRRIEELHRQLDLEE